jgi:hypothetical protein
MGTLDLMISAPLGIYLLSCGIIGWFFGNTGWVAHALLRLAPWGCSMPVW